MQATLGPLAASETRRDRRIRLPRPSPRRVLLVAILVAVAIMSSTVISTLVHLRLPTPTGDFAVGRVAAVWTDESRPEPATPIGDDARRLRIVAWYPAEGSTGAPAPYLDDLDAIRDGLVASGSVSGVETSGLGLVGVASRVDAAVATGADALLPIVILSPGNATNVAFYGALAEDLASHGYVVLGLDHPYQVGAVALDGSVAVYAGDPPLDQASDVIPGRIDERVADIGFVLERLAADGPLPGLRSLDGRLDLDRVGVMGHSNGGVAAAQACADRRVVACVNIDGQLAGGPFGARPDPVAPTKPFLFLTKETEIHPALESVFEAGGRDTFRVVVPVAAHDTFTDGPMFRPRLLPTAAAADDVITLSRSVALAFFDHTLRGTPAPVFDGLAAPTDVTIYAYPLQRP